MDVDFGKTASDYALRCVQARAEQTGLPDRSSDVVTAGQCWHWFDRKPPRAKRAACSLRQVADIESFSFDADVPYSHEVWLGRIRASSGVAASLSPDAVERFNAAHRDLLARNFPDDPLHIPHRVFVIFGRAPNSDAACGPAVWNPTPGPGKIGRRTAESP